MKITRKEIAAAIVKLLDSQNSQKVANEVAAYLSLERRTRELEPLMRDVTALRAQRGILEATATSAFELSAAVKNSLKDLVKKQEDKLNAQVILHEVRDPSVIGGVKLLSTDTLLDLTVHSRLKHLTLNSNPKGN